MVSEHFVVVISEYPFDPGSDPDPVGLVGLSGISTGSGSSIGSGGLSIDFLNSSI